MARKMKRGAVGVPSHGLGPECTGEGTMLAQARNIRRSSDPADARAGAGLSISPSGLRYQPLLSHILSHERVRNAARDAVAQFWRVMAQCTKQIRGRGV